MDRGTLFAAIFVLDVVGALMLGFMGSLLALRHPRRRFAGKPSRAEVATQAHTTLYFLLSLLGTVLVVAVALADGIADVFQQEQAWAAKQPFTVQGIILLLVCYLFFGIIFFISHQATDSFTPLVKRSVEHLEETWRAYRSNKPVSEEEAQLRYSFAPEWP